MKELQSASMKITSGIIYLIAITVASDHAAAQEPSDPKVSTPLGEVVGSNMTSRLGKNIYAFRGMRYAEAPINHLRFKIAVPAKPWTGVFNASVEGPSCGRLYGELTDDDCLRVNVYTTKLPADHSEKSPVIVFFHPGGFHGFSGQSYLFGPQYLLDEDIVLVTVNNRIGVIGFTAMSDELAPGNLGLKDQVEALRWVQKNIASFNGDPNCVTIVGYSAGAWGTVLHMLSPMSTGLFHRVVSMSGSPIQAELLQYEQKNLAKKQAELVGCPTNTTADMLHCFETIPQETMAGTFYKFHEWHYLPIRIWSPVVEPDLPGVERFVVDQPVNLIRRGQFQKVPFMAGSNSGELGGWMKMAAIEARKGNNSLFDQLNERWDYIVPMALHYERNTTRSRTISEQLRSFYFKNQTIGLDTWDGLFKLFADTIVSFPVNRLVNLVSQYSDKPVYYYHFVYQGRYSYNLWCDTDKPIGVMQHDDLMYLFYMQRFFPYFVKFDADAPEIPTIEHMTAMWASFAKTGNPIPSDHKLFKNIVWEPFTSTNKKYMEINSTLTMKSNVNAERMEALDRIFPIPPLNN